MPYPTPNLNRVVVLHGVDDTLAHGRPADATAVQAGQGAARSVRDALERIGCEVVMVPAMEPVELLQRLREIGPGVVFQMVESVRGEARLEGAVSGMLELAGYAYTGSSPDALTLALDKWKSKAVLRAHGIPTPNSILLERGDEPLAGLRMPVIVKPVREDASHGIDSSSVTSDPEAARRRAKELIATYHQPALIEEFVPGREFNVGLLGDSTSVMDSADVEGPQALPLAEIDFSRMPSGRPHVVTYESKWDTGSADWHDTPVVQARMLSESSEVAIREVARRAYRALGLRDYGRVDLRLHGDRGPFVLEVNPNPDLSTDAGLACAAARGGLTYDQLVERILRSARRRAAAGIAAH